MDGARIPPNTSVMAPCRRTSTSPGGRQGLGQARDRAAVGQRIGLASQQQLSLSVHTVRTHMRHIFAKLGVHRRTEAVTRARALGLLAPSPRAP